MNCDKWVFAKLGRLNGACLQRIRGELCICPIITVSILDPSSRYWKMRWEGPPRPRLLLLFVGIYGKCEFR